MAFDFGKQRLLDAKVLNHGLDDETRRGHRRDLIGNDEIGHRRVTFASCTLARIHPLVERVGKTLPGGAAGCFLRVDPQVTTLGIADGAGVLLNTLAIPASVGLRGLTLYAQAMLLDPANNLLGVSMSNDTKLVLGDRGY